MRFLILFLLNPWFEFEVEATKEKERIVFRVKVFFRAEDFFDFPGNFEIREEKICWFFLSFDQRIDFETQNL